MSVARSTSTSHRGLPLGLVAAATLVAAAACGSATGKAGATGPAASVSPAAELRQGLSAVDKRSGLTVTTRLDTTAAQLQQLAKSGTDPTTLTTAQAQAIAGGSIVLVENVPGSTLAAAQAAGTTPTQVEFAVNAAGTPDLIDVRVLDKTLYVRAAVTRIAALAGSDGAEIAHLAASIPASDAFLHDALAGRWISLPLSTLKSLEGLGGAANPVPSVGPSQATALRSALAQVLTKDVTVTRAATDPTLGDHLVLTGSSRTVATDLVNAVKGELGSLPGGSTLMQELKPGSVPDKTVKIDAYVKNGVLSTIRLDVAQFTTGADLAALGGKPFYVEAILTGATAVATPAGVTAVSLPQLLQSLGSLGGSSTA